MKKKEILILTLILLVALIPLNIFFISKYLISFYACLLLLQLIIIFLIITSIHFSKKFKSDIKIDKHLFYAAIISTFLQVFYFSTIEYNIIVVPYRYAIPLILVVLILFFFFKNIVKLKQKWKIFNRNSRIFNLILFLLNLPFLLVSLFLFYYLLRNLN